LAKRKGNKWRI